MLPEPLTRHLTDEELLLDFYDEGTAVDRTRVRTHLAQCEECRALDQELRAVLTARLDFRTPSFCKIWRTCTLTVTSLMYRARAISAFVRPCAISSETSRSLGERL